MQGYLTRAGTVERPQIPSDWLNGYLGAGRLILSGDALFARYTQVWQSPFGLGYVVGVADGILRYTATVAGGDSTVVTGMTDGAFSRRVHGTNNAVRPQWASGGAMGYRGSPHGSAWRHPST